MSQTSAAQAVTLTKVCKEFRGTVAVKDLSLEVVAGEFLFLLGPSGSGKTTLLRLIGGYEQPTRGRIEMGRQDITRLPIHRRNIGMVFQNYALFPHMTVAQNVAFGLKMRRVEAKEVRTRVAEALELVELDGLAQRFPDQLSGGQQQRVALARAVVYRPELLLLDEPLANLDRQLRDNMRFELKKLQQRIGITTIMVTHDQEESLAMADRIAVLHQGQLEQLGTPAQIYTRPRSTFIAAFIGEMNLLQGKVVSIAQNRVCLSAEGLLFDTILEPEQHLLQGQSVVICLRAERIRLETASLVESEMIDDPASPIRDALVATIEFVTYMGASTLYLARPDQSTSLLIKIIHSNTEGWPQYSKGERVRLRWEPQSLIFYFQE